MISEDLKEEIRSILMTSIKGPQDWNEITGQIVNVVEERMQYACRAISVYNDRDRDNYRRSTDSDHETLSARSLDDLYENMAKFKIRQETNQYNRTENYYSARFEDEIHIMLIEDDIYVDDNRIDQTSAWKTHAANLVEKAAEEARKKAEAETKRIEQKEAAERAEYQRLQAKFGDQND